MTNVDWLIIGIVDYIMVGMIRTIHDVSQSPAFRRGYTHSAAFVTFIFAMIWPLPIWLDACHQVRMGRTRKVLGSFCLSLPLIAGLVLWSWVAYLVVDIITENYWLKIPLFLLTLHLCIAFVMRMVARGKREALNVDPTPTGSLDDWTTWLNQYGKVETEHVDDDVSQASEDPEIDASTFALIKLLEKRESVRGVGLSDAEIWQLLHNHPSYETAKANGLTDGQILAMLQLDVEKEG